MVYYAFGTLCLPQSDFSVLPLLPAMYRHCKAFEDKDMTPFDFIKDHLINIDHFFDPHEPDDEQKPHTPVNFHQQIPLIVISLPPVHSWVNFPEVITNSRFMLYIQLYHFIFSSSIFRPPTF